MKRYGYLYQDVCDINNIYLAHQNARRKKTHYREVQMVDDNREYYLQKIAQMLETKSFRNADYTTFMRSENGKTREIFKLPYYPDRIVHHAIMNVVKPVWKKVFIRDTYSAIEGRGIHDGVRRIQQVLQNPDATTYCLKADVLQFYPSIDHDMLKSIIRKKIKDPNLLWLLDEIIDSTDGIPIGNYLSQYFGNLYLAYFDHWLKENIKAKYYYRYCDDFVIFNQNKAWLHKIREKMAKYLADLKLHIKDNWQVFPVASRGVDFLGYVFYHGYTQLRKEIKQRFQYTIEQIRQSWQEMNPTTVLHSVMSYWGWLKHADCRNLWQTYIDKEIQRIVQYMSNLLGVCNPLEDHEALY